MLHVTFVCWVAKTLEECFHSYGSKEFIRMFRCGNNGYTAQRSSNNYGRFLYLIEFKRGSGSGMLIFPEEVEGHRWMKMVGTESVQ